MSGFSYCEKILTKVQKGETKFRKKKLKGQLTKKFFFTKRQVLKSTKENIHLKILKLNKEI